ncbi:MAG: PadR family transcriptional regulator [Chloroflexota bacterium]
MLKYILLGFLQYGPMTGYDLKRVIDFSTTHFWHAYHSQIYSTLRKMDADGLVASETDDSGGDKLSRRVYTLTEAGEATLNAWLGEPMTELPAHKDESMVRVFFSGRRDKDAVLSELRLQRELHQQRLATYHTFDVEDLLEGHPVDVSQQDSGYWAMTLRHGMEYETMYIRWLEEMIDWVETL